ncbi:MAG: phosphatase PAP2 family protein [Myxococcaceae bacterium]|nr:phosphatase PAP2 family protein [Myxococcaceae bacterium]
MATPIALLVSLALAATPTPAPQSAGLPPPTLPATPAPPTAAPTLAFDWLRDGLLTAGAAAVWIASDTVGKHALAPAACRWCERDVSGADVLNPLDAFGRGLRVEGAEKKLALVSDGVAFAAIPLSMLGLQTSLAARSGALPQAGEDALMVAEAVALSALLTQGVKFAVGRARPFVHASTPLAATDAPDDHYLSFFSGHSSFAFSAVVAAGTVAELRGREGRWVLWAVGLPLAAAVPVFRMTADKHYLSDVLVGSAVGAAVGWAVPTFLHPRLGGLEGLASLQLSAGPRSVSVSGAF